MATMGKREVAAVCLEMRGNKEPPDEDMLRYADESSRWVTRRPARGVTTTEDGDSSTTTQIGGVTTTEDAEGTRRRTSAIHRSRCRGWEVEQLGKDRTRFRSARSLPCSRERLPAVKVCRHGADGV